MRSQREKGSPPMGFRARLAAMIIKEALQLRRDRLTFAMMFGMPIMQLMLFGYAINNDPKGLPAAILSADHSTITRSIVAALGNTGYFKFVSTAASEHEANQLLQRGDVQFVVTLPSDMTRRLVRHERAQIAIEADATDPATTGNALAAVNQAVNQALSRELTGALAGLNGRDGPVEVILHRRYNPEGITRYNVVPGLLGVILTMTMVMMTALAVTRERERGTMENLLAMPIRPIEVMIGKIAPYIVIGCVQVVVILIVAKVLFNVPIVGSLPMLALATMLFITVNLAIGFTFSTIAQNQLQAMQMSFFFLMPSILLSGFAFPFRGMPGWAQVIGEALPTTHFLRVVRGLMLKGATVGEVAGEMLALVLLLVVVSAVALARYSETLD
jgi:ABC-2 type transport system permease protein